MESNAFRNRDGRWRFAPSTPYPTRIYFPFIVVIQKAVGRNNAKKNHTGICEALKAISTARGCHSAFLSLWGLPYVRTLLWDSSRSSLKAHQIKCEKYGTPQCRIHTTTISPRPQCSVDVVVTIAHRRGAHFVTRLSWKVLSAHQHETRFLGSIAL